METLQDISLACCTGMCCVGAVGGLIFMSLLRRTGRSIGDLKRKEGGGLFGFDLGSIADLLTGGR